MPHHKSAIKRNRQNPIRRERNRGVRSTFRTALKKAEAAIAGGDKDAATTQLVKTLSVIGSTEKKGIIHANKAARHSSRLTKKVNAMGAVAAADAPAAAAEPASE